MKKTETRYVVERRDSSELEWEIAGSHSALRRARSFVSAWKSFKPGRRYRIVKVTTTREVVR